MAQGLFTTRRVMWVEYTLDLPEGVDLMAAPGGRHCCEEMSVALDNMCEEHGGDPMACPDMVVVYSPICDEYGLPIRDGGASYLTISHCPFCGAALGKSRRDGWFDALEARGIEAPMFAEDPLPPEFLSHRWWSEA